MTSRLDAAAPGSVIASITLFSLDGSQVLELTDGLTLDDSGAVQELAFPIPDSASWAGVPAYLSFSFLGTVGAYDGDGWQLDNIEAGYDW